MMHESAGPDLLALLAAMDAPAGVHALMPNMATACGLSALDAIRQAEARDERAYTLWPREATCPTCLAAGDLDAMCSAMMRSQATPST